MLNGPFSSGKSSIAVELQTLLPRPFLTFGVDTLVAAVPQPRPGRPTGISFGSRGEIVVDESFRRLEHAWYAGLAAIAEDGVGIIVEEVFLGGRRSQKRLATALQGLCVVWVGVRCQADVAVRREASRPDRIAGMAASQADIVHDSVTYDLEVDTTDRTPVACAEIIAAFIDAGR